MRKAFGLCRVSTIGQKDNTSLEFQRKRINDYATLFNIAIEDIITETESGAKSLDDRSGLSKLKKLVKNGECDTIIVNKIDRLGRSLLNGLLFLRYCEENNTRVISIAENIDSSNSQSKLLINVLWSIAEHERDMIKSRLADGRQKRFNDGYLPHGRTSFGYKKNHNGDLVVDADESRVIQYIYKRYLTLSKMKHLTKTKRTQKLLHSLKTKGYTFRGKSFSWWNIKQILSNPFYYGVLRLKGEETKHSYQSIVSRRLYNLVNTK